MVVLTYVSSMSSYPLNEVFVLRTPDLEGGAMWKIRRKSLSTFRMQPGLIDRWVFRPANGKKLNLLLIYVSLKSVYEGKWKLHYTRLKTTSHSCRFDFSFSLFWLLSRSYFSGVLSLALGISKTLDLSSMKCYSTIYH